MKLIKDILKSKSGKDEKFSQGRVYLFITFISYIAFMSYLTYKTIRCDFVIDTKSPEVIISALQWLLGLLAGYVFGAKGLEALKIVMGKVAPSETDKKETAATAKDTPKPNMGGKKEEDLV